MLNTGEALTAHFLGRDQLSGFFGSLSPSHPTIIHSFAPGKADKVDEVASDSSEGASIHSLDMLIDETHRIIRKFRRVLIKQLLA